MSRKNLILIYQGLRELVLPQESIFSKFAKQIVEYEENHLPKRKEVFFIYTHGAPLIAFVLHKVKKIAKKKEAKIIGSFHSRGYDTYVMKRFGGIAKKHPNEKDMKRIQNFYQKL